MFIRLTCTLLVSFGLLIIAFYFVMIIGFAVRVAVQGPHNHLAELSQRAFAALMSRNAFYVALRGAGLGSLFMTFFVFRKLWWKK